MPCFDCAPPLAGLCLYLDDLGAFDGLDPGEVARDRMAAHQKRHQCHQGDERQILKQQHREGVTASSCGQKLPLTEQRQNNGG